MHKAAFAPPDVSDPPFLPPPAIVLDLPVPPSVNRIWRGNVSKNGRMHMHKSPVYRRWMKQADLACMERAQLRGIRKITGKFSAQITIQRCQGDLDNRIKGLLDWAQSREIIRNDKDCEGITITWGDAPAGCRLTLVELAA